MVLNLFGKGVRASFLFVLLLMMVIVQAQTPPNDECVDANEVYLDIPYTGSSAGANGMTTSDCLYSSSDYHDVWHKFIPPHNGTYLFSLCDSEFDTTLVLMDSCGGTELVCNDDSCYEQSRVLYSLDEGETCYIRIAGFYGATGIYTLSVTEILTGPAYDDCNDAQEVFLDVPFEGTTVAATGTDINSCGNNDYMDTWHYFNPPYSGMYIIDLCDSEFDTTLALYDGCGGSEILCSDTGHTACGYQNFSEMVDLSLDKNNTYYLRISGAYGNMGDYTLLVTTPGCQMPESPVEPMPIQDANEVPTGTILSWNGTESPGFGESFIFPKIIYGEDDRMEQYEVMNSDWLLAGDATVALVDVAVLTDNGNGTYTMPTETLAEYYEDATGRPLCPDEPYIDQPVGPYCSGFLVAPDIVATAGHCEDYEYTCGDIAFVFGYYMLNPVTPQVTIDESQIYYCSEIIDKVLDHSGADWALMRLDRKVTDHLPVPLRRSGSVALDDELLAIGHPMGLPRKYASEAVVRDISDPDYFEADLDVYGGNSGSPVFSKNTFEVEGILVRGNEDFVADGDCDRSNVCPETGCGPDGWEEITRATLFSDLVPSFDVYLGADPNSMALQDTDIIVYWYDPGPLQCGTNYYWQVVARNECGETASPVWSFTTTPSGDFTHDCIVDLIDWPELAAAWLDMDCSSDNSWCDGADLDHLGNVDLSDLYIFLTNWLIDLNP
ncbi:MAG: trypsin-like peptidase domain-containing protein [Sedimentisphaerales bacterium]|nr:trypsin-like peptidase domain-containing protein [Sedimentisphaerales bacterium]